MTVEIRPTGNACNLRCEYCYQNPVRDNNIEEKENYKHLDELLKKTDKKFVLFGGEPLIAPIEVIEQAWRYGFEKHGGNSMQSNGALITDEHIELMKKYNVHAGISIDGKEELNDLRWAGSKEKTQEATAKTLENIKKMIDEGISVSIIMTLHEKNASPERIPKFKEWLREMDEVGVSGCRFHLLEKEGIDGDNYALSNEGYLNALIELSPLRKELDMHIDKYDDVVKVLKGEDSCVTCTWTGCDPWHTGSVITLDYEGNKGCGRPHKDGREWLKHTKRSYDRTIMLYETPQEDGGCKDCKYFAMCKGQCAGTGIDGDWRNRSEYCEVWKGLFDFYSEKLEEVGITPVHKRNDIKQIEELMVEGFKKGNRYSINKAIHILESESQDKKTGQDGARLTHNDGIQNNKHQDKAHSDHRDHLDGTGGSHQDKTHNDHKDHLDNSGRRHKDHLDNIGGGQ